MGKDDIENLVINKSHGTYFLLKYNIASGHTTPQGKSHHTQVTSVTFTNPVHK